MSSLLSLRSYIPAFDCFLISLPAGCTFRRTVSRTCSTQLQRSSVEWLPRSIVTNENSCRSLSLSLFTFAIADLTEAFFVDRFGRFSSFLILSGVVTGSFRFRWESGKRLFGGHNLHESSDESGDRRAFDQSLAARTLRSRSNRRRGNTLRRLFAN